MKDKLENPSKYITALKKGKSENDMLAIKEKKLEEK